MKTMKNYLLKIMIATVYTLNVYMLSFGNKRRPINYAKGIISTVVGLVIFRIAQPIVLDGRNRDREEAMMTTIEEALARSKAMEMDCKAAKEGIKKQQSIESQTVRSHFE